MADLGPGSGGGDGLAGRFVSGTSLRVRRLVMVSVGAVAVAAVAVWNRAVRLVAGFVGWAATTPVFWWYDVLETTVAGGFGRLLGPAVDAAASFVAGLGVLAFPVAAVSVMATYAAGTAAWRWAF